MRFYFVDRVTELDPGRAIRGFKNVSMAEPYFTFHFQRFPVMPGVLVVEALAQLAGLLVELSVGEAGAYRKAILSIVDRVKFREMVRPGDRLDMAAELLNLSDLGAACSVAATVAGKRVAETTLTFALEDARGVMDGWLEDERRALYATLLRDLPGYGDPRAARPPACG